MTFELRWEGCSATCEAKGLEVRAARDFARREHHIHSLIPLTRIRYLCAQCCGHHDEQDISAPNKRAVQWGRQVTGTGWAAFPCGGGQCFPTRGKSMCKGQESRAQDILVGGWGFLVPRVHCCVGYSLTRCLLFLLKNKTPFLYQWQ